MFSFFRLDFVVVFFRFVRTICYYFYTAVICSVLEYVVPVWYTNLQPLTNQLETIKIWRLHNPHAIWRIMLYYSTVWMFCFIMKQNIHTV